MPFFEISGKIFETEYGPITEMDVIEAVDDMTAMYIITKGDFSDIPTGSVDKITKHAKDEFERNLNMSLGVGLGISSLIPGPAGPLVRKGLGGFAATLQYLANSQALDAYTRMKVKQELRKEYAKIQAREEGRRA